jgi:hypothetical protein
MSCTRSMIWSVSRMFIRRPFGRAKILVIHGIGIGIGLYNYSSRWEQPIYILEFLEGDTPIPLCTEDNKRYVCLWCVEQRMEHPHFTGGV